MSLRSFDQYSLASHRTGDGASQDPALLGASIAFKGNAYPTAPLTRNYSGTQGALAAATKAGLASTGLPDSRRAGQTRSPSQDGRGQQSIKAGRDAFSRTASTAFVHGERLSATEANRRQSPSHLAATRAAARATPAPLSKEGTGTALQSRARNTSDSRASPNDESSIPATNKLVELFESKQQTKGFENESQATPAARIVSPVPIRPVSFLPTYSGQTAPKPALRARPAPRNPPPRVSSKKAHTSNTSPDVNTETIRAVNSVKSTPPTIPVLDPSEAREKTSTSHGITLTKQQEGRKSTSFVQAYKDKPRTRSTVPPPRKKSLPKETSVTESPNANHSVDNKGFRDVYESDSSTASFASAREAISRSNTLSQSPLSSRKNTISRSSTLYSKKPVLPPPPPKLLSLQVTSPTAASEPSPPPMPPRRRFPPLSSNKPSSRDPRPGLTADSLANAMVASSLASSRAPSPTKSRPIPLPPRRQNKHQSFGFLTASPPSSRAPSPLKPMRQTLRPAIGSSSDDDFKGYKPGEHKRDQHHHLLKRKHPNKHAEGDRQRWRDTITEMERKRYEGVWAANCGSRVPVPGTGADEVHGLVVKDIWQRSGLPDRVLEEVWELVVDFGKRGSQRRVLRKEEFVVGIWLVDQSLKGRKLPPSVGNSVWGSARKLMGGMRVR